MAHTNSMNARTIATSEQTAVDRTMAITQSFLNERTGGMDTLATIKAIRAAWQGLANEIKEGRLHYREDQGGNRS